MKQLFLILLLLSANVFSAPQKTLINFPAEAWYSISTPKAKIGYLYSKFEWTDASQKQIRYSSTLIRKFEDGFFEEQLQEITTADLKPISLRYRQVGDKKEKFISIDIAGDQATIETKEGSDVKKKSVKIPQGSVFGSFVNFMFLSMKNQMKPNQDYSLLVIDEGDFTLKDCLLKLRSKWDFLLKCGDNTGLYKINETGLIVSQDIPAGPMSVKKTDMKTAQKGFPKPGEKR